MKFLNHDPGLACLNHLLADFQLLLGEPGYVRLRGGKLGRTATV
jgi:hypothetical protein